MSDYAPQPKPGALPQMTTDRVMKRAQFIVSLRGLPPYNEATFDYRLTMDEVAIINDFITYWLPLIKIPEKTT